MLNCLSRIATVICIFLACSYAAWAQPALTIADASTIEGDSGTNLLVFVVSLSGPAAETITVNYTTFNGTAVGSDFVARSGTLTFDPGVTNQPIEIGVRGDTLYETNEAFIVGLNTPVNATITRFTATGTILNDDSAPTVSISDARILEGNSGTSNLAFQVRLSAMTGLRIAATYATFDRTAVAGSDYRATNGVISFAANSLTLTQTISVPIIGDTANEAHEFFRVDLTSISNAPGAKVEGFGIIIDDDPLVPLIAPIITQQPQSQTVNAGNDATFTVTVTNDATLPIVFQWRKDAMPLTNIVLNATTSSFSVPSVGASDIADYQVVIINPATTGGIISDVARLTVPAADAPPDVVTLPATDIAAETVVLQGSVNPNHGLTTLQFEYGLTESYGSKTIFTTVAGGTDPVAVAAMVEGLIQNTVYHFRLIGGNGLGTNFGADQVLTTAAAAAPIVGTSGASGITFESATLTGSVNGNGGTTTAYFDYGQTLAYGSTSSMTNVGRAESASVSLPITGLADNAFYHYRIVAFNPGGTNFGSDQVFQTLPAPDVVTLSASLVNSPDVLLRGSVNPNGSPASAHFEYGLSTNYGSVSGLIDVGSGTDVISLSNVVAGLIGYTEYHFRLVAGNGGRTTYGPDQTFVLAAPQPYSFATIAGRAGGIGSSDGTGSEAGFYYPSSVAVDSAGNVYVADASNETIRKITPAGVVSTFAGLAGNAGCADGTGSAARFNQPEGVAVDSAGNVYVADRFNSTIRKITPGGVVTTFAGVANYVGSQDGVGSAARFRYPRGLAVDSAGFVYVADTDNRTIRKISPSRVVTTLAGLAGVAGSADGTGSAARFGGTNDPTGGPPGPEGVAVDSAGNVYVGDTFNSTIRKITPGGVVSTLAGLARNTGSVDAQGNAARFYFPGQVAVDSAGNVYVADGNTCTIRKITPGGLVSTFAGQGFSCGNADGTGNEARFWFPHGVAVDSAGYLYVADFNQTIRRITPQRVVSTLAGATSNPGSDDGVGSDARFDSPRAVAVDGAHNVYIADSANQTIRKMTAEGVVSTLAGLAHRGGSDDGTGDAARFWFPSGIAVDTASNVYVADTWNHTIRKITPQAAVTTLAGLAGSAGSDDGTGSAARFYYPVGVAVDGSGNVYVGDSDNCTIRKITPSGVVSTLAGLAGSRGRNDGIGSAARFWYPAGVTVDTAGNVYVADSANNAIRKITPEAVVSTLAGLAAFDGGNDDGIGNAARFNGPLGVGVDIVGNIYVADTGSDTMRKITPGGTVVTLGGLAGSRGNEDGIGSAARFNNPQGIAVDSDGTIYVADSDNNTIRRGSPTSILITRQPVSQTVFEGGTTAFDVQASSTLPLTYQWRRDGVDLVNATERAVNVENVSGNQAGNYQVVISNSSGSLTSSVARLTVISGAPSLSINLQPQSTNVSSGTTVTLTVSASGNPPPGYQWRRNGVNIPGAVSPTLTLAGAQPTDGGRYSVIVSSLAGSILSDPAEVVVTAPALPLADNFASRVVTNLLSALRSGSNTNATKQLGETNHFGKIGGKSVWFAWQAPANGIATFSTLGSAFDTLLAVYSGTALSNLTEVASDDDRAGFLNSQVSFKAVAGTLYSIAIDGFSGASGHIVLSWNVDTSVPDFPRFIVQPLSQTVTNGSSASFSVQVASQTTVIYQWFYNCQPIGSTNNSTANSPTLVVTNVQSASVGSYTVRVTDSAFRTVESLPAFLEIGGQPEARSQDKLEDLLNADSGGSALAQNAKAASLIASVGSSGFVSVSAGSVGSQVLNNFGATTQDGEPIPCGVLGGSSKWFGFIPATDGVLLLDTIGSLIDTVLAVYSGPDLLSLTFVACDNNSAPDRIRSLVRFPVIPGTRYYVAMDGLNGEQGTIKLNWKFGVAQVSTPRPVQRQGANVILGASVANSTADTIFQWRRDGINIPGATNTTFTFTGNQSGQTGLYTLVVSNFVGAATNTIASFLQLAPTVEIIDGQPQFRLHATTAPSSFTIDASSDLVRWDPIYTNAPTQPQLNYFEPIATRAGGRFYRVSPLP